MVEARLKRGTTGSTATVDWNIATDSTSPTGFGDPVIEPALRVRIGTTSDAASTGDGSVIAILKRLRELLNGNGSLALTTATLDALETVTVANTTRVVSGTVALTTATLDALDTVTVANTTRTVSGSVALTTASLDSLETVTADQGTAGSAPWLAQDDFSGFTATHFTFASSTSRPIDLSTSVRMYRVTNWSTSARILVKTTTITSSTDGGAARVGVAPSADLPNGEVWPITSTTLHVLSTGGGDCTVEAFDA